MAGVYVEVDLSEFDTEEIIEELKLRKKEEAEGLDVHSSVTLRKVAEAMQRRDHRAALEMMRSYLQDSLGIVIP